MNRRLQVTFDAADPHQLARWWADLLRYEIEDHNDRVAKLLADGFLKQSEVIRMDGRLCFADVTTARDPADSDPRLFFQRVPEPKAAKNRVHLDVPVEADELDSEVERLQAAGASLVGFNSYPGHRSAVLRDPEGNEFCLH